MSSRRMERLPAEPTREAADRQDDPERDPEAMLPSLLPETPSRLLVVGWDSDSLPDDLAAEIVRRPVLDGGGAEEAFEAILWRTSTDSSGRESVGVARERLADQGRLILLGRFPPGEIPAGDAAAAVRSLVRELSEAGFVILKESEPGALAGDGRGVLLVARRDPFVVRAYREGDERVILQLFTASFHVERSLDHWCWKYRDHPWGAFKISLAFAAGGELAAHYSGYPVPFWHEGGTHLGLHMGDTMTGAEFRNVGRGTNSLLGRTVRHFFAIHRDGPFGFFFGFNTGPIQRFCRWFIGGSRAELVRYRVRRLDPESPPEWRSAAGYRIRRVDKVDGAWDRLFRRVAPHYRFLVHRDAQYVDWRYLQCPERHHVVFAASRWGRLVGWSVFRRREDRLVWGDALFDPRHAGAAEPILAAAVGAPELAGASYLETWFPDRPDWWDRELDRLGLETRPEPNKLGLMVLPDTEKETPERLRYLYYTMGDGDLF
ncbi:MAG: hypothetical protein GY856_10265 [bacterium]|nr:hypothetical protein [bacterium]